MFATEQTRAHDPVYTMGLAFIQNIGSHQQALWIS